MTRTTIMTRAAAASVCRFKLLKDVDDIFSTVSDIDLNQSATKTRELHGNAVHVIDLSCLLGSESSRQGLTPGNYLPVVRHIGRVVREWKAQISGERL